MKDNKLIAEFMGEKFTDNSGVVQGLNYKLIEKKHGKGNNGFRFHTSWDWLMPVVDKCTQIGFRDTDTDDNPLYELWDRLFCDNMGQFVGNHIDEVYNSVVEFIKTYNDER
tara:strand:- start:107 stop:439 length:333 start_codon:yes stop_codon:yes gene_type:complete